MNGSSHPVVPGLKLGDLAESTAENCALTPVAGRHISGSNGSDDVSTVAVLPPASRRTSENKVSVHELIFVTNCIKNGCGKIKQLVASVHFVR